MLPRTVSALSIGGEVIARSIGIDVIRAAGTLLEWARAAHPDVLADLVSTLGRVGDPALAQQIAPLAEHAEAQVRVVVAQVLGGVDDPSPAIIATLVLLSSDRVEEVRSWA